MAAPPTIDLEVEERASEQDRVWFENHPGRNYCLRLRLDGELAAKSTHVLVMRLEYRIRIRMPLTCESPAPPDCDRELERLVEILMEGGVALTVGGRVFSLEGYEGSAMQ